ncbi:hypothetical protein BD626DRAFT_212428 [Schizophyllum amplum]|uniref:Uncharacterized protein n=1 Tax=Schizophyllum amplum TaxID=97359 RepID=A0A550BXV3_9AGAR|nr:hypothetical protein BD626DRAFT_212428 [Auriculariopsis ampla]
MAIWKSVHRSPSPVKGGYSGRLLGISTTHSTELGWDLSRHMQPGLAQNIYKPSSRTSAHALTDDRARSGSRKLWRRTPHSAHIPREFDNKKGAFPRLWRRSAGGISADARISFVHIQMLSEPSFPFTSLVDRSAGTGPSRGRQIVEDEIGGRYAERRTLYSVDSCIG